MSGLNPPQKVAVNHESGPLLVLAGAGTGKTRVITYRIAKLISNGVPPERILGVTFTNKAANEMQERLKKLLGPGRPGKKPLISTFHSLCVRILRRHIHHLGYPPRFAIYSGGEQESLARSVLREINVVESSLAPGQLLSFISRWKNRGIDPGQAQLEADSDAATLAAIAYRRYQAALKRLGAVDFDDLLGLTVRIFRDYPTCRAEESDRFDHILIDEYQDTNHTQYEIVKGLASSHRNLCVVGDDDQSIYGWRGAEVEHILNFKRDWVGAETVRLVDNYRSTQSIIAMANQLIEHNKVRHGKVLKSDRMGGAPPQFLQFADETKEAESVVASIASRLRTAHRQPRDFAVLFRTNEQTRPLETAFRKAKIPYVLIGGMSFFDRKEVQDILAYLRIVNGSPDDTAVLRILNRPARGVGKKAIENLLKMSLKEKKTLWEVVTTPSGIPQELGQSAVTGLGELVAHVAVTRNKIESRRPLVDAVLDLLDRIGYRREIEKLYSTPEEREMRWNAVQQIVDAIGSYEQEAESPTLTEFLDQMLLGDREIEDEKEKQLRQNSVFLMTIHAAKGLEFPEVYLVGMEEGILPHHRSVAGDEAGVAEERRLCYVAVTRAQDVLTMSMALGRMKWGKSRLRHPSRFVYELLGRTEHPNYSKVCQTPPD